MWVINELPEENRILLLYDMMEGLDIGFYDAGLKMFYNLHDHCLRDVCAWMYIPNKPKTFRRITDLANHVPIMSTKKTYKGGTEDVQTQ